jgi:hypothetical protein
VTDTSAPEEVWRWIAGYEDRYQASNLGRIRSIGRMVQYGDNRKPGLLPGRVLKPFVGGAYLQVTLHKEGVRRTAYVHRVVAETFLGIPNDETLIVCHNDGKAHNNYVDNLRWDTVSANLFDAVKHGDHHYSSRNKCSKGHELTPDNVYLCPNGRWRQCRTCHAQWRLKSKVRKAAA